MILLRPKTLKTHMSNNMRFSIVNPTSIVMPNPPARFFLGLGTLYSNAENDLKTVD